MILLRYRQSAAISDSPPTSDAARIVHHVATIGNARNRAYVRMGNESITAETLVYLLSDRMPKLIIFDLQFSHSETDAAEQLN